MPFAGSEDEDRVASGVGGGGVRSRGSRAEVAKRARSRESGVRRRASETRTRCSFPRSPDRAAAGNEHAVDRLARVPLRGRWRRGSVARAARFGTRGTTRTVRRVLLPIRPGRLTVRPGRGLHRVSSVETRLVQWRAAGVIPRLALSSSRARVLLLTSTKIGVGLSDACRAVAGRPAS
jgi:hypothetical protein